MRRVSFVLLLLCVAQCFAQETEVTPFFDEPEDSLSSLTIMPIKRPKELLMQVMEHLDLSLRQRHEARKYQVKASYEYKNESFSPIYVTAVIPVESDNGLEVGLWWNYRDYTFEDFHIDTQNNQTLRDTDEIKRMLLRSLEGPAHLSTNQHFSPRGVSFAPWLYGYNDTKKRYKITAYSIIDDAGRGVYKIDFVEKWSGKKDGIKSSYSYSGTAYFDISTLCLTQFKSDHRYSSTQVPPMRIIRQQDYEEKNGFPVLKQVKAIDVNTSHVIKYTAKVIKLN